MIIWGTILFVLCNFSVKNDHVQTSESKDTGDKALQPTQMNQILTLTHNPNPHIILNIPTTHNLTIITI